MEVKISCSEKIYEIIAFQCEIIATQCGNVATQCNISKVMALNRMTVYQIIKKYQTTCRVVADKRSGIKCAILNEKQKNEIQKWIEMYYDFKDCQIKIYQSTIACIIDGFYF